jgi:hypothetical protein
MKSLERTRRTAVIGAELGDLLDEELGDALGDVLGIARGLVLDTTLREELGFALGQRT